MVRSPYWEGCASPYVSASALTGAQIILLGQALTVWTWLPVLPPGIAGRWYNRAADSLAVVSAAAVMGAVWAQTGVLQVQSEQPWVVGAQQAVRAILYPAVGLADVCVVIRLVQARRSGAKWGRLCGPVGLAGAVTHLLAIFASWAVVEFLQTSVAEPRDCLPWEAVGGGGLVPANAPLPAAGARWPEGLDPLNPVHMSRVRSAFVVSRLLAVAATVPVAVMAILMLIDSHQRLGGRRQRLADSASDRLRNAIAYVSHEARGPLNAASLGLAVLDDLRSTHAARQERARGERRARRGSAHADAAVRESLIADVAASVQAASRHLDDLLRWEDAARATMDGPAATSCAWALPDTEMLDAAGRLFGGRCEAAEVSLLLGWREVADAAAEGGSLVGGWTSRRRSLSSERRSASTHRVIDLEAAEPGPVGPVPALAGMPSGHGRRLVEPSPRPGSARGIASAGPSLQVTARSPVAAVRDVIPLSAGPSRVDTGRPPSVVGPASRFNESVTSLGPGRRERPAVTVGGVDVATNDATEVLCDHDLLLAVLHAALSNAVKFTPPGGEVRAVFTVRSDPASVGSLPPPPVEPPGLPRSGSGSGGDAAAGMGGGAVPAGPTDEEWADEARGGLCRRRRGGRATCCGARRVSPGEDPGLEAGSSGQGGAVEGWRQGSSVAHSTVVRVPSGDTAEVLGLGSAPRARVGGGWAAERRPGGGPETARYPGRGGGPAHRGSAVTLDVQSRTGAQGAGQPDTGLGGMDETSSAGTSAAGPGLAPPAAEGSAGASHPSLLSRPSHASMAVSSPVRHGPSPRSAAEAGSGVWGTPAGTSGLSPDTATSTTPGGRSGRAGGRRRSTSSKGVGPRGRRRSGRPFRAVLEVQVRDTGPGIARSLIESGELFEPFKLLRRGDSSMADSSGGMGLAIAQALVVGSLRGQVGVSSNGRDGTVFFARVPVWARVSNAPSPAASAGSRVVMRRASSSALGPHGRGSSGANASSFSPRAGPGHAAHVAPGSGASWLGGGGSATFQHQLSRLRNTSSGAIGGSGVFAAAGGEASGVAGQHGSAAADGRRRAVGDLSRGPAPASRPEPRQRGQPAIAEATEETAGPDTTRVESGASAEFPDDSSGKTSAALQRQASDAMADPSPAALSGNGGGRAAGAAADATRPGVALGSDADVTAADSSAARRTEAGASPGAAGTEGGSAGRSPPSEEAALAGSLRPRRRSAKGTSPPGRAGRARHGEAGSTTIVPPGACHDATSSAPAAAGRARPAAAASASASLGGGRGAPPLHSGPGASAHAFAGAEGTPELAGVRQTMSPSPLPSRRRSVSKATVAWGGSPGAAAAAAASALLLPPGGEEGAAVLRVGSTTARRMTQRRSRGEEAGAAGAAGVGGRSRSERAARRAAKTRRRTRHKSSSSASLPPRLLGRAAMVVEDERTNRTLLGMLLRRWGLRAAELCDGQEAVEALAALVDAPAADWPVIITLDVEMPRLDGFGVLARIKEMAAEWRTAGRVTASARLLAMPVLVLTGNAQARDREELARLGAARVLPKPVEAPKLAEAIAAVTGKA